MQSNKTVILGEASESDGEEISLDDRPNQIYAQRLPHVNDDTKCSELPVNSKQIELTKGEHRSDSASSHTTNKDTEQSEKTGSFGLSLIASTIGASSSTLAKFVNHRLSATSDSRGTFNNESSSKPSKTDAINRIYPKYKGRESVLHRNLYTKNQQLHACLAHIHRHPFEQASQDLNTISQRLVSTQRIIQDVDVAVSKMKRDRDSFNSDIRMFV